MVQNVVLPTPIEPIQELVEAYLAGESEAPKMQRGGGYPNLQLECVCQVCSGFKCSCVDRHHEQIGMCMVHGEDMFAADIYRAIHAAHAIEIAGE